MNEYLRWGGGALLMIGSLFAGREYRRYTDVRLGELCGFIDFLNHAKREISTYLTPTQKILRGFKNESLEALGFISGIERYGSLGKAFSECADRSSLGKESKKLLSECFSGFGQGYKDAEISRSERYVASLNEILETEREELVKNAKIVSALLLSGAVGIFILLL